MRWPVVVRMSYARVQTFSIIFVVLWTVLGVDPKEVWSEMDRRERLFGIAEKLPKHTEAKARRKVTPFPIRRAGKRG